MFPPGSADEKAGLLGNSNLGAKNAPADPVVNTGGSPARSPEASPRAAGRAADLAADGAAGASPAAGAASAAAAGFVTVARDFADFSVHHAKTLASSLVQARAAMRRHSLLVTVVVGITSASLAVTGIFLAIGHLLTLRLFKVILNLYQVLFAALCVSLEIPRFLPMQAYTRKIHRWCPLLELNVGKGLLHVLTGGLAVGIDRSFSTLIPGLVLLHAGISEIIWGVKAALKIRELVKKLQEEDEAAAAGGGTAGAGAAGGLGGVGSASGSDAGAGSIGKSIMLLHKKFAVLDLNGDGKLSLNELKLGCEAVNLPLSEGEAETIFTVLDPKGKGYVSVEDLESWWINSKDEYFGDFLV